MVILVCLGGEFRVFLGLFYMCLWPSRDTQECVRAFQSPLWIFHSLVFPFELFWFSFSFFLKFLLLYWLCHMVCRILVPTTRDRTHVSCTAMESWVQMLTPGPIGDLRGKWGAWILRNSNSWYLRYFLCPGVVFISWNFPSCWSSI